MCACVCTRARSLSLKSKDKDSVCPRSGLPYDIFMQTWRHPEWQCVYTTSSNDGAAGYFATQTVHWGTTLREQPMTFSLSSQYFTNRIEVLKNRTLKISADYDHTMSRVRQIEAQYERRSELVGLFFHSFFLPFCFLSFFLSFFLRGTDDDDDDQRGNDYTKFRAKRALRMRESDILWS